MRTACKLNTERYDVTASNLMTSQFPASKPRATEQGDDLCVTNVCRKKSTPGTLQVDASILRTMSFSFANTKSITCGMKLLSGAGFSLDASRDQCEPDLSLICAKLVRFGPLFTVPSVV